METNPIYYGLSAKTQLKALGHNHIGIVKMLKSRIIQKDAHKIVDMALQIKQQHPSYFVSLVCSRNICSKSIALLQSQGIGIEMHENLPDFN